MTAPGERVTSEEVEMVAARLVDPNEPLPNTTRNIAHATLLALLAERDVLEARATEIEGSILGYMEGKLAEARREAFREAVEMAVTPMAHHDLVELLRAQAQAEGGRGG